MLISRCSDNVGGYPNPYKIPTRCSDGFRPGDHHSVVHAVQVWLCSAPSTIDLPNAAARPLGRVCAGWWITGHRCMLLLLLEMEIH